MSDSIFSKSFLLFRRLGGIAWKNPRGLRPVFGHALAASENHLDCARDISRLPAVTLEQLAAEESEPVEIAADIFPEIGQSIMAIEAVALGVLLRKFKAQRVFEFGTHRGVSTTQLALNIGRDGRVFTLELPRENRQTRFDLKSSADAAIANQDLKADLIPARLRDRVTFLEHDSATFDEHPYAGTMDAVFVDGAHVYEYVRNDSEKGWRMLRTGGVIIWHDFRPQTPDVMRYLFESNFQPKRIQGTTLAFAVKLAK